MDKNLLLEAEKIADRGYSISVSIEKETSGQFLYMAKNPELFGCMAQGESQEDAIKNLRDARIDYIYDSLKNGSPIPDPVIDKTTRNSTQTGSHARLMDSSKLKIQKNIPDNAPSERIRNVMTQYYQTVD